ncbi:MAG: excinuclease ABC subunit UvrA [Bacteroidaceae bacterium]|nr:excinuclease ABC subunit UvrA [Bacteroidaceae bacterium]
MEQQIVEERKMSELIQVLGARVHNLKNVDVEIPRNSLAVITGLSGSGKSSLAFDTIFAEGQRRYIETFSAYARNFLGNMERPDVDKITGLSPVISIEQKTTNRNPRSTVGTTTEIYDYLRLLFARAGEAFSYVTGERMVKYTEEQLIELILKDYDGRKIYLMSPLVKNRKGHYRELFESIQRKGFLYVRVDGVIQEVMPDMKLDRYKNHSIEVVVDRLIVQDKDDRRLQNSVASALKQGDGEMLVYDVEREDVRHYSRHLMCPTSGIAYREPAPHDFSFNSPQGACPHCHGLGYVPFVDKGQGMSPDADDEEVDYIGITRMKASKDDEDEAAVRMVVCPECHGKRLRKESLYFRIADKNIIDLSEMDISELYQWMKHLDDKFTERQRQIAPEIIKEICTRLHFLLDVGLDYLSLSRSSVSLSGGESQRIRLATQIGSQLVNVLYILDEPSIGLHQRDNRRLIRSLKSLRDIGNTVIVVEHDQEMMEQADYIVDMGPRAGRLGGEVVYQGSYPDMLKVDTLTSRYLNGTLRIDPPAQRRRGNGNFLSLRGCTGNNLQGVDVDFPLGVFICVTGVSGSGKSTLINDTLHPILSQHFYRSLREPLPYESVSGIEHIDKVVDVDQSPLGRTPRSNPATYTGVFNDIRQLFVQLPEAKIRGYKPGRFSFNVKGGRCEVCSGNGYRTIEMNFLPDVYVPCDECQGKRYNRETLEVRYRGKSIADVLNMTINQAVEFFEHIPHILNKIKVLQEVGLGYLKLGQPSTTLSGGESQRVKLATELAKKDTGNTFYILDEPTTGLHFDDIRQLLSVINRLVDKGNTVLVIEHNLDVIRSADYLIDMGPEGGRGGGKLLSFGTPEKVAKSNVGYTPEYLR